MVAHLGKEKGVGGDVATLVGGFCFYVATLVGGFCFYVAKLVCVVFVLGFLGVT